MPHTITVGCRVSAQVGPLERREGAKRRCKVRYIGTVLDSAPEKAWIVWWDDIHKCSSHSCRSLRFEGPTPRNFHVKMTARKIQQLIKKNFVTDPSSVPLGNATANPPIPTPPAGLASTATVTVPPPAPAPSVAVTNDDDGVVDGDGDVGDFA